MDSESPRQSDARETSPAPPQGEVAGAFPPQIHRSVTTFDVSFAAILKVILAIAAVRLLLVIWPVLLLVVFSLMLVATFNPLVRRLQARLARTWAITLVVTGAVVALVGFLALLLPPLIHQGSSLVERAPEYTASIQEFLDRRGVRLDLQTQIREASGALSEQIPQILGILAGVVSGITGAVTITILTVYLLIEGPEVGRSMLGLLPPERRPGARRLVAHLGTQVGGYMRGQIITSALAGLFTFVLLFALGIPESLALAALCAITDAIPIVGLFLALIPAALLALTLSPVKAGIVVAGYLLYNQLENNYIAPKVYGNTLGLSLSAIMVSILIGVELLGMVGAILALPVAAAIPSILAYVREWQEQKSAAPEPGLPPQHESEGA